MEQALPLVWIAIIAFCIVMYVVLDGFTLGTGLLMPFFTEHERDLSMSVILPTWDGNQTWLVLGGACLYGAFPAAFALLLPVLYLPLMLMLIALLFRGVAFEFRLKAKGGRVNWDWVFFVASLFVTLIQGAVLGNFIEGFSLSTQPYLVSDVDFFTPFTAFTALCLVFGYALLGSTRLILKTESHLQEKAYKFARILAFVVMVCLILVSIWTPLINHKIFARWYENNHWIWLSVLPYVSGLAFVIMIRTLFTKDEKYPYYCAVMLFLCGYVGFIISLFPYIVPYELTFWQAAAPNSSLGFTLVGAIIMLPILLIYTGYSYHIFRGKVKDVLHY